MVRYGNLYLFSFVLFIMFTMGCAWNSSVLIKGPRTNRLIDTSYFKTADAALYRPQRSLRDQIGYPCACLNQICKCCILIHTTTKPTLNKEVCIDSSWDHIKPAVGVKMFVNQKPVITYNLRKPIDSCIQYKLEHGWKFCLDFKQVRFTSTIFHFCINLQMYHHDQFTIFYFRCLDLPREVEKLQ